jgi:hypothetical protein
MSLQQLIKILLLALLTACLSCRSHSIGRVNVDGDGRPRFTFTGLTVSYVVVYRVPAEYLNKGIPLDALTKDNPDTQWLIEGSSEAQHVIRYGFAPQGMKEILPAKPLAEGPIYFVSTYISTEDTGAFVGQYFRIQNGHSIEVHEEVRPTPP